MQDIDIHEAYIVVRDGMWVGFWLPAENGFVARTGRRCLQVSPGK